MEPLPVTGLPHYRAIVALDIERSTSRPDPIKADLRNKAYELFDAALYSAGIRKHHRDRYIDRGDGLLALIHPVDQAPKALLLNRAIPALSSLLADYNASLPPPAGCNGSCGSASSPTQETSVTTPTGVSARHSMSRSGCSTPHPSNEHSGRQPTR